MSKLIELNRSIVESFKALVNKDACAVTAVPCKQSDLLKDVAIGNSDARLARVHNPSPGRERVRPLPRGGRAASLHLPFQGGSSAARGGFFPLRSQDSRLSQRESDKPLLSLVTKSHDIRAREVTRRVGVTIGYAVLSFAFVGNTLAEDWLQFRGDRALSSAPTSNPPVEFSEEGKKNIAWKTDLPGRSAGGVIVVGKQVISSASDGLDQRRMYITSVAVADGRRLWQQSFVARGRPFSHPYSSNAAPTPASDGKHIFAFYSSNDLVCLNLDGELVWYRSLATEFPKAGNDTGMSSSPLVLNGIVVVQVECQGDSFAAGLDAKSGDLVWRIDRPRKANWNSPTPMLMPDGKHVVVLTSGEDITGLDVANGQKVFSIPKGGSKIPSTLAIGGKLFVASEGLTAYDVSKPDSPEKLWSSNKVEPGNSSPIVVDDSVICVKGGVLSVGAVDDGSLRYKLRLPDAGSIWSTPVVCGERLYVFSDEGKCFVVELGKSEGKLLATNLIKDTILGSPAVSGNSLFVRGDRTVWKIGL